MLRLIRNAAGHAVIDFWEALRCCGKFRAGSPQMPLEDGEGILASRASSGGVKEVPVDGLHDAVCSRLSSCADALCADFLCRRACRAVQPARVQRLSSHYNIAPSQMTPVVRDTGQGRELVLLKWGLIPSWAKDSTIGVKLINARAETLADKPALKVPYA